MNKAEEFILYKSLLFTIAYKMTGGVQDSEDIVQSVFEKWVNSTTTVFDAKAYLAKAVINQSIHFLKQVQSQREVYFGIWLPEPLPDDMPDYSIPVDQELQYGFLLLLENLSPMERAVYLLRESFDFGYREIAEHFSVKEDHCRQLYHRAKERLHGRKRFEVDKERQQKIQGIFEHAVLSGDLSSLIGLLKEDVITYSDGGGKVPAAVNAVRGKESVSKFLQGIYSKNPHAVFCFTYINGCPAAVVLINGVPDTVAVIEADEEGISHCYLIRNPDKIGHIQNFL